MRLSSVSENHGGAEWLSRCQPRGSKKNGFWMYENAVRAVLLDVYILFLRRSFLHHTITHGLGPLQNSSRGL